MKKMILGLAAVALVGSSAWFITSNVDSFDYVATVDSELSQLEAELAELDAAVAAGTLTEAQATEAKIQIIKRLNTIDSAAAQAEQATLTPAQRAQLLEGLDRLKTILVNYQDTLTVVEDTSDTEVVQNRLRRGGSSNNSRSLQVIVAETITNVEDSIVDIITDGDIDETIDEIIGDDEATETESTDTDTDHVEETEEVTEDEVVDDETETTDETVEEETPAEDTTTADEDTEIVS